jgi:signal transduction histidine kinase
MQGMGAEPIDPRWPRLLGLAVHEFRTPITVVAGYIRMLLKERAGAISDQQRRLLEEAEKSCGRLSALVSEMSDLSSLEGGTAALNRGSLDLAALLTEVIAALPPLPDREVAVALDGSSRPLPISADATRLRGALTSVLLALRREVITTDRLIVRVRQSRGSEPSGYRILVADAATIDSIGDPDPAALDRFDEWRGGSGLSLAIARRIIAQHGGSLHAAPGGPAAAAIIFLPRQ